MANTATRGSKTGRATTKAKPGPKPGSTRKPRAAKTFKLYASDGGDQLAYLVTQKGKNGPAAIQSAIEGGLVAPDIKFVALEIDALTPHEVEATVNYAVKPLGKTGKRRGRPPKAASTTTTSAKPSATRRGKPGPKPGAKVNKDGTPRKKPGPKPGSTRRASNPKATPAAIPAPAVAPPSSPAAAGNPFADAA